MNQNELKGLWLKDENVELIGWDFSYIKDRAKSENLPWDYKSVIETYLTDDMRLLDLGTGGGEFLLTLSHPFDNTSVTEGYLPNYDICVNRLGRLGIEVKYGDCTKPLPFASSSFDIVIDRHESFSLEEVYRVLKPNGIFVTQQVGETNNIQLARFVLDTPDLKYETENELHKELENAQKLGFQVIQSMQAYPTTKYFDVGALVYLASVIEWEFPKFSVERCFDRLLELNTLIEKKGYFESLEHRYILVLKKCCNQ